MINNLKTILENDKNDIQVDSDTDIEELDEIMNIVCDQIAQKYYKTKTRIKKINTTLDNNFNKVFMNTNFDKYELIEEQFDELIHNFTEIKELMKHGRNIKIYKEKKETEKKNELRYARNELAHYGIQYNNK